MMRKTLAILLLALWCSPAALSPCSTFCLKTSAGVVFGRNYDWDVENCLVMVNKRGVQKTAFVAEHPARWTSRYGSITFNQYGREFPIGGMNEAGLVIECMWLSETRYPAADARSALSELQWIQYVLDTCARVEDILASNRTVRINAGNSQPLHFLACDRRGNAAAIEFLQGRLQARAGQNLPLPVLTNSPYDESLPVLALSTLKQEQFLHQPPADSLRRFLLAGRMVRAWNEKKSEPAVAYAEAVLKEVTCERTVISVVYDRPAGRIYFCNRSNRRMRHIDLKKFDFSCRAPVRILDILEPSQEGDVTGRFVDYSTAANLDLLVKAFAGTQIDTMRNINKDWIARRAQYPESLICK
jgi:penicillin V acylase-like amidase (Ntn superfamily)